MHQLYRIICEWQYIVFHARSGLRGRRCSAKGSLYIGVGFGWPDDVNHPDHCELYNQGFFTLWVLTATVHNCYRDWSYCAGLKTLSSHQGNNSNAKREHGKPPRRHFKRSPQSCLWSGHKRKQSVSLALYSVSKKEGARCQSSSHERCRERGSSPFMPHAEQVTAPRP